MELVILRAGGDAKPLFLVAGEDEAARFSNVLEEIESSIPVYCFDVAPSLSPVRRTIEGIAAQCVLAIRKKQPSGPFRILGLSQKILAHEIATQLIGADQVIEFMGVVALSEISEDARTSYSPYRLPIRLQVFSYSETRPNVVASLYDNVVYNNVHKKAKFGLGGLLSDALTHVEPCQTRTEARQDHSMVTIQDADARQTPLFFVPGAGDAVSQILAFTIDLGPSVPVYGWQYRGLDGAWPPQTSVEVIASACRKAIRERGLRALHLIGHSFGGWIAFELANQLRKDGIAVESLTLVDSEPPNVARAEFTAEEALREWIGIVELAAGRPLDLDASVLAASSETDRLRIIHASIASAGLVPHRSRPESIQGALRTFFASIRSGYDPRPLFDMRVHLITADDVRLSQLENESRRDAMVAGWQKLADDLVDWRGPGNHITILKPPNSSELAAFWKRTVASHNEVGS